MHLTFYSLGTLNCIRDLLKRLLYNHSDFKYNTPVVIDYKLIFPDYTDHANLHSMTVIDEMEYQSMPGLNVLTVRLSDTAA